MKFPLDVVKPGIIAKDYAGNFITVDKVADYSVTCKENNTVYFYSGISPIRLTWQILGIAFKLDRCFPDGYLDYWTFEKKDLLFIHDPVGTIVIKNNDIIGCYETVHGLQNCLNKIYPGLFDVDAIMIRICESLNEKK